MLALDVAGTTVQDQGVVLAAFESAFSNLVPEIWAERSQELMDYAVATMGQSKIEVFTAMLGEGAKAHMANVEFEKAYLRAIEQGGAKPIDGAEELFAVAKAQQVPVVLTTGFSRKTLDAIIETLGWQNSVDLTVTPSEAGRGRPHPDMLNYAAKHFGVTDKSSVVVAGDTESDIAFGLAFGSTHVYGVTTGAHSYSQLIKAGATNVFTSVGELISLITS
jgi:phosphonatase-like hydrolase